LVRPDVPEIEVVRKLADAPDATSTAAPERLTVPPLRVSEPSSKKIPPADCVLSTVMVKASMASAPAEKRATDSATQAPMVPSPPPSAWSFQNASTPHVPGAGLPAPAVVPLVSQ
jgi:hypothetical protein